MAIAAEFRPEPRWQSLQSSPDSLAIYETGRLGLRRGSEGERRERLKEGK